MEQLKQFQDVIDPWYGIEQEYFVCGKNGLPVSYDPVNFDYKKLCTSCIWQSWVDNTMYTSQQKIRFNIFYQRIIYVYIGKTIMIWIPQIECET